MGDFRVTEMILKKREGLPLSCDDIRYFVTSIVAKDSVIDRAQIGAMLMAIYHKGLSKSETSMLTTGMAHSGDVFRWPEKWNHLVVDKHSTGGVGDKVSLILAPALAAVGLKVPMISGRSLAHTGGTLDKLESIPGFRTNLTKSEIYNVLESVGCCIVGQTEDCAPADKVLYACREMTGTVHCQGLIIASIVSKKLCEGTRALVYDVKYGKGSIFSSKEEAIETAKNLVLSSEGTKASALLTSMEKPLGRTIGNSLEVKETIDCLKGEGPADVMELVCSLGSELLQGTNGTHEAEGKGKIRDAILAGKAMTKFHEMIIHQGVSTELATELCYGNADSVLPKAMNERCIRYNGIEGYIQEIDPLMLAKAWKEELFRGDKHPGVGLTLLKDVGDKIKTGEAWVKIHHESDMLTDETLRNLENSICVSKVQIEKVKLIERRLHVLSDQLVEHIF